MEERTMSEEAIQKELGPRKHLSKSASVAVMVVGGLMILIPWFFLPAEQGSALQIVKTIVGVAGFVALCVGAYYRP
jgi:VIT1/CCC1 family predicted Fe2+/Mn2+ transporter